MVTVAAKVGVFAESRVQDDEEEGDEEEEEQGKEKTTKGNSNHGPSLPILGMEVGTECSVPY